MSEKIEDDLFGKLEWNEKLWCWVTKKYIDLFNKEIEIWVNTENDKPIKFNDNQKKMFKDFLDEKDEWKKIIQEEIFEYYTEDECQATRDALSHMEEKDIDEIAPIITDMKEIDRLITPTLIKVNQNSISIVYDCLWETHGVGIQLENKEITYIGGAGEV